MNARIFFGNFYFLFCTLILVTIIFYWHLKIYKPDDFQKDSEPLSQQTYSKLTNFSEKEPAILGRSVSYSESLPEITITFDTQGLWSLINNYRQEKNLSVLQEEPSLCDFAQKRVEQIAIDWSHDGFNRDSSDPQKVCPKCEGLGENLAKSYYTPEEVMQAWLESPTHRANLDYPFDLTCLKVYSPNNYEIFIALEFGLTKDGYAKRK